ncbi:RICIN domain-containing protein [Streptomyces roseifaciens]|uniref:RICIN domain-containing protein n=1 Tax=Streptomyces roseifaciens TaxID=1488406 RepID=UPI000718100D|nr:RICIN domain-containing protein [Streptomyces roseifaciens]
MATLTALVTAAVGAIVAVAPSAPAAPDNPSRPFTTNNMYGSDGGRKWNSEVGPLAERYPVVALQEAGSGPPPVPLQYNDSRTIPIPGPQPHPNMPMTVNRSPWEYNGRFHTVYFLETHVERPAPTSPLTWGGGRNNLAVVTQEHADEVRVVNNPVFNANSTNNDYRARRALGVRLGNTVYYNIHARGNDTPQLLAAIRADVRPGENYVILGDYNRNIAGQPINTARTIVTADPSEFLARPDRPTHQNGGEIDYALMRGTPRMVATIPAGRGSDHAPVEFNPPAVPPPPPPGRRPAVTAHMSLINVATGNAVETLPASRRVIAQRENFRRPTQVFATATDKGYWYSFGPTPRGGPGARSAGGTSDRNTAADDRCPGINLSTESEITMILCSDPRAQWHPEDPAVDVDEEADSEEGGPVRWRNAAYPALCLAVETQRPGPMRGRACADGDQQLWYQKSRNVRPREWDGPSTQNQRLLAPNGSILRTEASGTGDRTNLVIQQSDSPNNQQRWYFQYTDYSDNLVRLIDLRSGKCMDVRASDHARPGDPSVVFRCQDPRTNNDNTGRRWRAETDQSGRIRFRNEATHLCLTAPKAADGTPSAEGRVTVDECSASSVSLQWWSRGY